MKKHHSLAWSLCALAVIASPLTLDHVVSMPSHHEIYRSIAAEDAEPVTVAAEEPVVAAEEPTVEAETLTVVREQASVGPVLTEQEQQSVDITPLDRFNESQKDAIAAIAAPEPSTLTGAELLQENENNLVEVQRKTNEIKASLEKLLEGKLPEVKTTRDAERAKLIEQVANLNRLYTQNSELLASSDISDELRGLIGPTYNAVEIEVAKACKALEDLDAKVAELEQAAATAVAEATAAEEAVQTEEAKKTADLQARLDRADAIIARFERLEKERSCRATETTPVVTPAVTQDVTQMQMMMMNMISMNQTMITMMQMQMQQNMSGGYFSQPSWPMQNYYGMGIGQSGPSYALSVPAQQSQLPVSNVPTQSTQPQFSPVIQNFYGSQQGPTMGMPGAQFPQIAGGGFNFGSTDGGAAAFGNFSAVGGNPVASSTAQGIPFSF